MARVEPIASEKSPEPVEPKTRKKVYHFRRPGCFSIGILIVVVFVGWIGWLLASAGIIPTPFYNTLQPRRQVTEKILDNTELVERIALESLAVGSGTLGLSESELSKLLTDELDKLERLPLASSQLAIDQNDIELYGIIPGRSSLALAVVFVPAMVDEKLVIEVQHFQLGHLSLPTWIAQAFIGTVLTQSLPRSIEIIKPKSIQLSSGSILFTL